MQWRTHALLCLLTLAVPVVASGQQPQPSSGAAPSKAPAKKPPAAQSNAKAMIALGALYSSGTCTPRDLPTAYRWFALALHKQPDNQPLQDDLQKLWTQMTQPERQLAIKLSQ